MAKICLVACASTKQMQSASAKELYVSPLFSKSRYWAEQNSDQWFILSAKHGLLTPSTLVEPYNMTLKNMNVNDRRTWADKVYAALLDITQEGDEITFLAGKHYRQFLLPRLTQEGYQVCLPMEGLGIGKQLQWLTQNVAV